MWPSPEVQVKDQCGRDWSVAVKENCDGACRQEDLLTACRSEARRPMGSGTIVTAIKNCERPCSYQDKSMQSLKKNCERTRSYQGLQFRQVKTCSSGKRRLQFSQRRYVNAVIEEEL
jgi:hypothetical protein